MRRTRNAPLKPFLSRGFGDDSGNLYEGQISDFNTGLIFTFEVETNELENDRSDLESVVTALQADDASLWNALNAVIDMDAFLTYWAFPRMIAFTSSPGAQTVPSRALTVRCMAFSR